MNVVIGTAGHIDHGKTALVKALTGIDADRLPEEKKRGITIDIGFAELDLGDVHASFVDVPGHERFVKNMLAGASGIDLVMLVVAADEGVMPQTREHFNICRLLGLERGILVITKADLADGETIELVRLDFAELVEGSFLQDAEPIVTSSASGLGVDVLKDAIREAASTIQRAGNTRHAFLPIDRSFSVKGYGAVITGTLQHGEIGTDSTVEILPQKTAVRVRGIQSHGRSSEKGSAGNRVAVNLGGIDHSAIERGMVLADKDVFEPTQAIDAEIEVLGEAARPVRSRQRVRVHIGTSEILARVTVLSDAGEIEPGEKDLVQLRLESPAVAVHGTRLIIRSYSPQETIAGGRVLDPFASRHRRRDIAAARALLSSLAASNTKPSAILQTFISAADAAGMSARELGARTGLLPEVVAAETAALSERSSIVDAGGRFLSLAAFESLRRRIVAAVKKHHETDPLSKGISKELLRERIEASLFAAVLDSVVVSGVLTATGDSVALAQRRQAFTSAEVQARSAITERLSNSGLEPPRVTDLLDEAARSSNLSAAHVRKLLQTLIEEREVTKVSDEFYFSRRVIDALLSKLRASAAGDRTIDVAKFKEISGVSRKYAIPLLEYLDGEKITIRTGDKRVIR